MSVRKLCLRLNDDNPLHNEAWTKIEASGKSTQGYLLEAVLAFELNPFKGLPEVDIDRIAERIIWRLDQTGKAIGSEAPTAPFQQEELQMDEPENEAKENLVPDNVSDFLSGLD